DRLRGRPGATGSGSGYAPRCPGAGRHGTRPPARGPSSPGRAGIPRRATRPRRTRAGRSPGAGGQGGRSGTAAGASCRGRGRRGGAAAAAEGHARAGAKVLRVVVLAEPIPVDHFQELSTFVLLELGNVGIGKTLVRLLWAGEDLEGVVLASEEVKRLLTG